MKDKLRELAKIERVRLFVNASDENLNIPTRVLSWLSDYANILEAKAERDGGDVRGFSREDILRVLDYANAPGMKCVTAEMTAMLQEFLTQYEEKLDTPEVIPGTLNALGTLSIQPKDKQA